MDGREKRVVEIYVFGDRSFPSLANTVENSNLIPQLQFFLIYFIISLCACI